MWGGLLLIALGIVGASAAGQSLAWQMQTRWKYTSGHCRVVKAEVVPSNNGYELNIEHQVEVDGQVYRATRNTEQTTPSYNNLPDAETALASYPVGSLQPCWYDAADPNRHSVLVRRDMDTLLQSTVMAVSLLLGITGIWLLRR